MGFVNSGDVERFQKGLQPHHQAVLSDGTTWLQRAITEHNLLAASRLYTSVSLDRLGRLLNVDASQVWRPGSDGRGVGICQFAEGDCLGQIVQSVCSIPDGAWAICWAGGENSSTYDRGGPPGSLD